MEIAVDAMEMLGNPSEQSVNSFLTVANAYFTLLDVRKSLAS